MFYSLSSKRALYTCYSNPNFIFRISKQKHTQFVYIQFVSWYKTTIVYVVKRNALLYRYVALTCTFEHQTHYLPVSSWGCLEEIWGRYACLLERASTVSGDERWYVSTIASSEMRLCLEARPSAYSSRLATSLPSSQCSMTVITSDLFHYPKSTK